MGITGRIVTADDKELVSALYPYARHKALRTWIIVADRRIAKVYAKNDEGITLIARISPEDTGVPRKGFSNHSLGRVVSSCSRFIRHRLEPRHTPEEEMAYHLARDVADYLELMLQEDVFDRLIIVAAPAMLGQLRKSISRQVYARISAEAARDLTKMKNPELLIELKKIVPI